MLGIHAIATGIRPQTAETIVRMGNDLSSIQSYATVEQALRAICT